jgi:hypothetical protein
MGSMIDDLGKQFDIERQRSQMRRLQEAKKKAEDAAKRMKEREEAKNHYIK